MQEVRSAEVTGRPHGRNQGEKLASTQRPHNFGRVRTTGEWTFGAQRALLGSRHKDNGRASKTHIDHLWRRLQRLGGTTLARRSRTLGRTISEISAATQLWSPATWSARSLPPEPSWEGSTWRGHNGVQSRPDHILLSVDLASPPVTVDFRSSRNLMRTALAPIDHAPLRIALQYLSVPSSGLAGEVEAPGQGETGGGDEGPPLCEAFHRRGAEVADPSWQHMESSILNLALAAFPAGDLAKRRF